MDSVESNQITKEGGQVGGAGIWPPDRIYESEKIFC